MDRVSLWRHSFPETPKVHLSNAIDLTTSPCSRRASFPYNLTPALRVLRSGDILNELVNVPDFDTTTWSCFAFGALTSLLLPRGGEKSSRIAQLLRLLLSLLSMFAFLRFVKTREPTPKAISSAENVSSSPHGPCRLVARVVTISNSHAGTHADTPRHFHVSEGEVDFPPDCYTGLCHVIDVSDLLPSPSSNSPRAITVEMLKAVAEREHLQWKDVWRVLFITRRDYGRVDDGGEDAWDATFAHFQPAAAEYLATEATQLLLVGLDTPSMDHPNQSPICHGAHGALYRHRIALLENLDLRGVQLLIRANQVAARSAAEGSSSHVAGGGGVPPLQISHVQGTMMTVFIPAQSFPDAKGCAVVFFPNSSASTTEH